MIVLALPAVVKATLLFVKTKTLAQTHTEMHTRTHRRQSSYIKEICLFVLIGCSFIRYSSIIANLRYTENKIKIFDINESTIEW